MATDTLITKLFEAADDRPSTSTIDVLHDLLDDSTIDPDEEPLGVSDAARLVGLPASTLRYYERLGLVRPDRDEIAYRRYRPKDLRRLIFLTRMRLSGMSMQDLRRYIALVDQGADTEDERRQIMFDQRARIKHQLRELNLALEVTEYKIRSYGGHPGE